MPGRQTRAVALEPHAEAPGAHVALLEARLIVALMLRVEGLLVALNSNKHVKTMENLWV